MPFPDGHKVISATFIIGSATAALGGVLIASHIGQINFYIGFMAGIKAFVAAVLGGIANIPGPGFFGMQLSLRKMTIYIYYLMIGLVMLAVFVVNRLINSRIGRAWIALREDEIACEAMGIDRTKTKLTAFALGATWAGMGGVIFAAKTTFINPACFTIWESIIILCIVVLGGMGSIPGVILGAMILILLPEYLRTFSAYRMLIY